MTRLSIVFLSLLLLARVASAVCVGDCGGRGSVGVGDLVRGVNIALGNAPASSCAALDANANGAVSINELLAAVGNALSGCAAGGTPTPSPTPTVAPSGPCGDTTDVDTFYASPRPMLRVYRTGGMGNNLSTRYAAAEGYRLQIVRVGVSKTVILNPGGDSAFLSFDPEDIYEDLPHEVNLIFEPNPAQPQVGFVGILQCDKATGEWFLSLASANGRLTDFVTFSSVPPS